MNGTIWMKPGQGVTAAELLAGLANCLLRGVRSRHLEANCRARLIGLGVNHVTNLDLTGEPLTEYDLRRIAECE